jgi:hypothetical protein
LDTLLSQGKPQKNNGESVHRIEGTTTLGQRAKESEECVDSAKSKSKSETELGLAKKEGEETKKETKNEKRKRRKQSKDDQLSSTESSQKHLPNSTNIR